ncbi:MAG: TIGR00341 family protein [Candidatus Anstonellales archaeon]
MNFDKLIQQIIYQASDEEIMELHRYLVSSLEDYDYFLLLALATIIATFGLMTNNASVVIGAMILSPMMSKIISLAYALLKNDGELILKSFKVLVFGIITVIISAMLLGIFYPYNEPNNEILSRTKPTLFDLGIAIAAGIAGAYTTLKKNLSSTLAGVAISVSLLPPLAVSGLGLAMHDFAIFLGAFLLFLANAIAINFASISIFWLCGVEKSLGLKNLALKRLEMSLFMLLIISIPLAIIMLITIDEAKTIDLTKEKILTAFEFKANSSISDLKITYSNSVVYVHMTVKTKEKITQQEVDNLALVISKATGKKVNIILDQVFYESVSSSSLN